MPGLPIVPERASNFANEYDLYFWAVTLLTVFFTTLVFALVIVFSVRYRRGSRASRLRPQHHNTAFEVFTISTLMVLAMGAFVWGASLFAQMYGPAPKDALEIFVIGKQWMWHLQHPNGVRENNELHIPVNKPVKLTMISQDVIHAFFVPSFRVKKDVIPGYYSTVWFTPTKTGRFRFFCAEYCGMEHSVMRGWVTVMEPAAYQQWLAAGGERRVPGRRTMDESGEELYVQLACGSCHGLAPARAPSLVGLYGRREKLQGGESIVADERYIRESILEPDKRVVDGYQPVMPTYKNQLNEDQVLQLIAFIKSMKQPPAAGSQPGTTTPAGSPPASQSNTTGSQP